VVVVVVAVPIFSQHQQWQQPRATVVVAAARAPQ